MIVIMIMMMMNIRNYSYVKCNVRTYLMQTEGSIGHCGHPASGPDSELSSPCPSTASLA